MLQSKYEKDMLIVRQHWNNFISILKQDFNINLKCSQRDLLVEIKKLERIEKILNNNVDNIDLILSYKDILIELDNSLLQKFNILEAFKKRNNLKNAVALRTFNDILNSGIKTKLSEKLDSLYFERDLLSKELDNILDLIHGVAFNKDIIIKYCEKYKLSDEAIIAVLLYPIYKSAKKTPKKTIEKKENIDQPSLSSDSIISDDMVVDQGTDIISYKDEFDLHKKSFEEIINVNSSLSSKYYRILTEMLASEIEYYRVYCSMNENQLKEQSFESEYEEAMSIIMALKLFDTKEEIEKMIQSIANTDFSDKYEIDCLGEYISEFKLFLNKLIELDKKLSDNQQALNESNNQKVFFLADKEMNLFVPEEFKLRNIYNSFLTIINKAQLGHLQQKNGCNIMPLKVSKNFQKDIDRPVFAVRNNKVIVSYIKLNSGTGLNDGGILILAASLLNPNTILEDTNKVISENKDRIKKIISALERGDPQEYGLQTVIRDNIMKELESFDILVDGDQDGKKFK